MNAQEIAQRLALDAEAVAAMLLPNGKRDGAEWVCGSVDGEAGKSLKVRISGAKAGVWKDFAGDNGGDLLDLWAAVRSVSFAEAFKEAREYLGITPPQFVAPRRSYARPERPPATRPVGRVLAYLTQERKLSEATLAAFKVAATKEDDAIVFPFLRDDELVNVKHLGLARDGGKKVIRQAKGAEPCLFGWHALPDSARYVAICEGEIDAMSLHQYGIPALSVNQGAGNHQWIDSDFDRLDRFVEIAVWFDADEPGRKGAREVVQRLGIERCRIVTTPAGLKDPNECLQQGIGRENMLEALRSGERIAPEELKTPAAYTDAVLGMFFDQDPKTTGTALPWPFWAEKVRLRESELSVWTGINGHGKSDLLGHVILDAIRQGERVCIFSGEMRPAKVLYRLTLQSCAIEKPTERFIRAAHAWLEGAMWIYDRLGSANQDALMEAFRYAAKRYRVTHFVVDSLMKCGLDEDDYNAQKAFIERLCDFKNEFACHVHLVAHPRKRESEDQAPGKLDIKGASAISDLADNVFTVWRNKRKERADEPNAEDPDAVLYCNKQRDGGYEGALRLWFDPVSHQFLGRHDWKPRTLFDFDQYDHGRP